jgi:hypothetical protein
VLRDKAVLAILDTPFLHLYPILLSDPLNHLTQVGRTLLYLLFDLLVLLVQDIRRDPWDLQALVVPFLLSFLEDLALLENPDFPEVLEHQNFQNLLFPL